MSQQPSERESLCPHHHVHREAGAQEPTWHCDECGHQFLTVETWHDAEVVTDVAASIMLKFHQKVLAQGGEGLPGLPTDDEDPQAEHVHEFNGGTCRCGASQFLGGS